MFEFLLKLFTIGMCLNFWNSIDPCAKAAPTISSNNVAIQDYEQPIPTPQNVNTNDNTYDQYAELEESQFAGYINQVSN